VKLTVAELLKKFSAFYVVNRISVPRVARYDYVIAGTTRHLVQQI
jgi:hypothetical protein